ncbi:MULTISPECIES: cysteine desulfurase family protein [Emticicia]|uniref:cysteine desulfurase family protein n=1 Tax=Emticicia TaxID=312278 RepID=UPI0007D8B4D8|nr:MULTISPECIES: IscS subfamily cysteine desulfurase [Emticicia]
MKYPIYMDYNATTPLDKRVLEAMIPYLTEHFGNAASRSHAYGWKAAEAVDAARQQVADLLGCTSKEIVFTSGATEAVNLAIKGVYEAFSSKGNHIITIKTEHKAVLDTCQHLEKLGAEITYLDVDNEGNIDLENLKNAIKKQTILISVMGANNEIGVIYPIQEIARIAHENGILFHTDATQAVGKIPVNVIADEIDLLNLSAHKLYGPKGVGALYVRKKLNIIAQQDGGKHERGLRSGTLNVAGIVGLGQAAEIAHREGLQEAEKLRYLRDKLEEGILTQLPHAKRNGSKLKRLSNTINISFGKLDGEQLLMNLNEIAVSNGSACNSASTEPSYVLKAMGLDDESAYSSVRFSLGRMTQEQDIDVAIEHVVKVVNKMY